LKRQDGPTHTAADAISGTRRGSTAAADGRIAAKYVRAKDFATFIKLPMAALVAWTLPEPWWDQVAGSGLGRSAGRIAGDRQHLRAFLGSGGLGVPVEDVLRGYRRNLRLLQAQYLRCHHPHGWCPDIRLEGREHLDQALADGRGAIVWVAPLVFAPLVTKMALHAAGYRLVHLSRLGHGYSPTRFGVRVLNPVVTRAENCYLAERVVIGTTPLPGALRTLARRLAANRVVSITAAAQGVKTLAAPFLGGELRLATGAPSLALRTGARLLPVLAVREAPGRFLTVIQPPLDLQPSSGRGQALQDLVAGLVARLERGARRWPDQVHWHPEVVAWHPSAG
jgi:lauroyl/myristoyl acyltransferase